VTTVAIRRLEPADMPALAVEVARAGPAGELLGSSDAHGTFFMKVFDFGPNPVAIASAPDGSLVGFISPEVKAIVVRPAERRQGIGRRLVEAGIEIERERGRPQLILGVLPADEAGRAFLAATGFAYHSTLWDLALPAEAVAAAPTWPAGIVARSFERTRDDRAWLRLFNAAFATHATPLQMDESMLDAPPDASFEDADILVLEDAATAELVGFCTTTPERADGVIGPHAEIWTIGVLPDRQGRGLGRQLLRWGVERLRAIGARDVSLSVNNRNEHALALYESEGFVRGSTRERWARPVPEVGA
jgi:mycothiol synthase